MNSRGIVVTPRFTVSGTSLHFPGLVGIAPGDLRFYLLYWDKIDYPNNNIIHVASSLDDQFLIDAEVMTRTNIAINLSGRMETLYVSAQLEALRQLNTREPGQWSLAQTSNAFYLPPSESTETRSIEFEFFSILPVPADNVALDDILRFKEERHDELLKLRIAMDELYRSVDRSNDIPRAKNAAILKLEETLKDLNRVANESWATCLLPHLKVEFSLSDIVSIGVAGEVVSQIFNVTPGVGAVIGAASAVVKLGFGTVRRVKGLPDELKDFAYLNHITDDLTT